MRCTYFHFEGKFRPDYVEMAGKRGFSSALVPCDDEEQAYEILKKELDEYGFQIIDVNERYVVDPDQFDAASTDENILVFINWHEEIRRFNATILQPFHLYDHNDDEGDDQ